MKRTLVVTFFSICLFSNSWGQVYWDFIMDTCSVGSTPSGVFVKDGQFCTAVQECGYSGGNDLRMLSIDDQLGRQDLSTSTHYDEYTRSMYQGIIKIHDGYLLANDNSLYPLIKYNENLQVEWSINLSDSLDETDGIPSWWCENPLTGELYGVGSYAYSNNYQCSTVELMLMKLDSTGRVMFKHTYPNIFQNSTNGYLYDYGEPRFISISDNGVNVSGGVMQFYPGSTSLSRSQTFFTRFDFDGNLLSIDFEGDRSSLSWVTSAETGFYNVRQELITEGVFANTNMRVYFKPTFNSPSELVFENLYALPEFYKPLTHLLMTTEGLLLLEDNSDNFSLGAKLIMFDPLTSSILWQKTYALGIDSSSVNLTSVMGNMKGLIQMPDLGFAFCGSVMMNNSVYPWYIRTDACGDPVYSGCSLSGVNEDLVVEATDLYIYPNPSVNEITLQFNNSALHTSIQIFNTLGELVLTEATNGRQQVQLNIANLASGVYTVVAQSGSGSVVEKFVKE